MGKSYSACILSSLRGWLRVARRIAVVFLLFTVTRVVFYLFNASLFPQMDFAHLAYLLFVGLKFDTVAIIYTNLLFLFLSFLPTEYRWMPLVLRVNKWGYVLTNGLALAMNLADVAYYRFSGRRSTLSVLSEFKHEGGGLLKLGGQFLLDYWYLLLIWLVLLLALYLLYGRDRKPEFLPSWRGHAVYFFQEGVVLVLVSVLLVAGVRGNLRHSTRPLTISNAGKYARDVREIAIILNTPFSVYRTASKKPLERVEYYKSARELNEVYNPVITPDSSRALSRKNIVVIIVESLSREYIGELNPARRGSGYAGYTPFLDSLVRESLTYRYSFANGHKSIDAMPSVLASIPMMVEPFVLTPASTQPFDGIATLLGRQGYRTAFFHGAPNGSMGFDAFARMAGFQDYYGMSEYPEADRDFNGWWGIWDEPYLQYYAQTMDTIRQPFMTALFTLSSHHPFILPPQYEGAFPKGTQPIHQCIGYTDLALRRFFETARQMPWFENTIFLITGDHTNQKEFAEYKTSLGSFTVPLIFYFPKGELKGMRNEIAQQIDVMPTLLGLIGYPHPYVAFGQDLLRRKDGQMALGYVNANYQLVMGEHVLYFNGQPVGLYQWQQDSLLLHNLLGTDSVLQHQMTRKLEAFIQQYNTRMLDNDMLLR